MTVLEAVVATVILTVVSVACLEATSGAAALQSRAGTASTDLAVAEQALAQAVAGTPVSSAAVRVRRVPYADTRDGVTTLDLLTVEVPRATGAPLRLSRLVPARATAPGSGTAPRAPR